MPANIVTSITPSKRNAAKVVIHVGGKAVATLPAKQADALAIEIGRAWDEDVAARVAEAVAFDRAFEDAMKVVNRRALSRAVVKQKLAARGHDADVAARALEKLAAIGAIDDAALARSLVDEIDRTQPSGPALKRAKLIQRGVGEDVIDDVLAGQSSPADQREAARRLIASREEAMARFDAVTRRRRLWGLLARRGFDEQVIESVLGEAGDSAGHG